MLCDVKQYYKVTRTNQKMVCIAVVGPRFAAAAMIIAFASSVDKIKSLVMV